MRATGMTVRKQLVLGFGGLAALTLLIACAAVYALSASHARFTSYVQGVNARFIIADHLSSAVNRRAIAARNLVLVTTPRDRAIEEDAVRTASADVARYLARLKAMAAESKDISAQARRLIDDIDQVESRYGPVASRIVALALQGRHDEAVASMNSECRPLLAQLTQASLAYSAYTEQRANALIEEGTAHYDQQRFLLIGISIAAIVAAIASGAAIVRGLLRSLGAEPGVLSHAAGRVAGGDLGPVDGAQAAPPGSVLASLSAMQAGLAEIVLQVRTASEAIASGSAQIAMGGQELSQRTEVQASSLQQTAATMDELGSTVRNNAANAAQANQLADKASSIAGKGGEVVGAVVETMRDINESSRQIAEIIAIIDGIAFQTNILALNAAVEAARAGEQGRGFSVVAEEVRNLAHRSAAAAKEIKTLITNSVEQTQHGSVLVDGAGATMQEIVAAIQRVNRIVNEISMATGEQSTGVSQVGEAVAQIDHATQQNAALVEESAAAAESLKKQAQRLIAVVSRFSLEGGTPAPV